MEYRVYEWVGGGKTFFSNNYDGSYECTHGGWVGDTCEVDGQPALNHCYGVAVYDSFRDLTAEEYDTEYNDYVS